MKVIVAYLMKPNRDPRIREKSLEAIRNQSIWNAQTPKAILRYPQRLYEGKHAWRLLKIIDVLPSEIPQDNRSLNSAIWIAINHAVLEAPDNTYICVWFDDVWIDSDALKRAINILEMDREKNKGCLVIGLPPIGGENNTMVVPMRWFVFHRATWKVIPISKLLEKGFPQLYVTGLWMMFGEDRSCFLRCDWKHLV